MEAGTWSVAGALLAAALLTLVLLPAPSTAELAPVGEPVDGRHLVVEMFNQGPTREAELRVTDTTMDEVVYKANHTLPANGTKELAFPVESSDYTVRLTYQESSQGVILSSRFHTWTETEADMRACPDRYQVSLGLTPDGARGHGGHCSVPPPRAVQLLEEAQAAKELGDDGLEVHVPLPGADDHGKYALWNELVAPVWEEGDPIPFSWQPDSTFLDAWGRTLPGAELRFEPASTWGVEIDTVWGTQTVSNEASPYLLRYPDGQTQPVSLSQMVSASARSSTLQATSEGVWEINYEKLGDELPCLFRNDLQGTTLSTGDTVPPPCAALDGPQMWAGQPLTHQGLEAVPVYQVVDKQGTSTVTRLLLADGIPYPLALERFTTGEGIQAVQEAFGLTHLQLDGDPMTAKAPDRSPEGRDLARVDPLDGPSLDVGGDRFGLTLAEASQAARMNPALTALQALLEDPETVLAGAHLGPTRDATETVETRLVWTLAYTAPAQGPLLVTCQREGPPAAAGQLDQPSVPVAVCQEVDEPPSQGAWFLQYAPALGVADIPSTGASFDLALERWGQVDPVNRTAPVTSASYRAWGPDHLDRTPALLAVGSHARPSDAGGLDARGVATSVAANLETGTIYAERRTLRQAQVLGGDPAPLTEIDQAAPGASPGDGDLPVLVGTAAGAAGLLALIAYLLGPGKGLLWTLYTRLKRPEVLEHPVRREILELVRGEPGLHAEEVKRQISSNGRTAEYHLDVLVREALLTTVETDGYTHFFEKGTCTPEEMEALAYLRHGQAAAVFQAICDRPGINVSGVAQAAGISMPYASKLIGKLQGVGLVDKVRDGRSVSLYAREGAPVAAQA